MIPLTHVDTTTKNKHPIHICLGDVFLLRSAFAAIEVDSVASNYIIIGLLASALVSGHSQHIYFTMVGIDGLRYSISKITKNGLIILNRGKEIELDENYVLRAMRTLSSDKVSGVVDGLELYIRTLVTDEKQIKRMNLQKLDARMMDLSRWPRIALRTWATMHLNLQANQVPLIKQMGNRINTVNNMIRKAVANRPVKMGTSESSISARELHDDILSKCRSASAAGVRFGTISKVPFINLTEREIHYDSDGSVDCVYPDRHVQRHHLTHYMVICIEGMPKWIFVPNYHTAHINWRFDGDDDLLMTVIAFSGNISLLMWAHKIEETALNDFSNIYNSGTVLNAGAVISNKINMEVDMGRIETAVAGEVMLDSYANPYASPYSSPAIKVVKMGRDLGNALPEDMYPNNVVSNEKWPGEYIGMKKEAVDPADED